MNPKCCKMDQIIFIHVPFCILGVPVKETDTTPYNNSDSIVKILPQHLIEKIFGNKRRRTARKLSKELYDYTPSMDTFTDYMGNRLRRDTTLDDDADLDEDMEKSKSTTPKESYGSLAMLRTTKETNKVGFVDIDLVPQTVVLNLRDNSSKHSRFKNFFKKFHFKKKKPKINKGRKPLYKRQCYMTNRRSRFNPIRKLKNMFKVRPDEDKPTHNGPSYRAPNVPDYEIITSHIDTFKHIKYDKPLSIDEMKKQIPNISDIEPETTLRTSSNRPPAYSYKLDDSDRDLLYHYHIPHSTPKPAAEVLSE